MPKPCWRTRRWLQSAAVPAALTLLLVAWGGLATRYPLAVMPSPLEVLRALTHLAVEGTLWHELWVSVSRLLAAFGLGVLLGTTLGLLAGQSELVAAMLRPMMAVAAGAPPISWIVLALIWFGTGNLTPILVALVVTVPVVFTATLGGVRALDRELLAMIQVFGLRGRQRLSEFYLPALAPHWLSGLSVGATLTVRVGIMGEFLASNSGIGSAMALARTQLDTATVVAWVLVGLSILFGAEGLLLGPLSRHLANWRKGA